MYRKSFIKYYTDANFSFDEAKSEIDFALEIMFNFTPKDFLLGKTLEEWQVTKLLKVIDERIKTRRPIQQLVGHAFFYNRRFFVNEYTLIPRPETEILVSEVLKLSKTMPEAKILDIGSGTGCIPITLVLENENITADSVDISDEAIETAKKNALFHNIYERTKFFKSNLFENVDSKYNVIVSNPPYIPISDKETLQYEVKNFDPALALFAYDEKGVEFYERIITVAKDYLLSNGYLCFEIGAKQCKDIVELLKANDFNNIRVIKDYNSIERVIISQK